MRINLFLLTFFIFSFCSAQKRNNIWCFGDSAGINFNNSNPVPFYSAMNGRGSCASISDTSGQLLFYAQTLYEPLWSVGYDKLTAVFNKNNLLMQGGDSIIGEGWYRELLVTDKPGSLNEYYLFSIGCTGPYGLYYSIIDMNQNGGLGAVVQKNVQLLPYQMQDGLQAIKHGNGRDWWIVCKRSDIVSNDYYFFLATPFGISGPFIQSIGTVIAGGLHKISFSPSGNRMSVDAYGGLIELFDFDRCTGILSNPYPLNPIASYYLWACEFSLNENILYISTQDTDSYLMQINLLDTDPWSSRDTLWVQDSIKYAGGDLRLAPDGRIYLADNWYDGVHWNYPYGDTAYYTENMNLGVINFPDSIGAACQFQPYSFYLGGKRCYVGLPNNPDYDLPSISLCDSLTGIEQLASESNSDLFIYYHSDWQIAFINAKNLKGRNYSLSVFDLTGREVYAESSKLDSYFTKDLNCESFANGMYVVTLHTEKEKLVKKFIKQ